MKKSFYYTSLIVLWGVVVFLLAILLILFGLIPTNFGFGYSLGSACGFPQLWIMAVGIVLLLRPIAWKLITKESKPFKKSAAITILIVGIIWLSINIGAGILNEHASEKLIEQYDPKRPR